MCRRRRPFRRPILRPSSTCIGPCFEAQGGASVIEPETYLYYIQLKPSQPSQGNWTPYNEETEKVIREDFLRLWNTNFLDNLSIEKEEYTFSNGVVGELDYLSHGGAAARQDRRLRRIESD